MSTHDGYTKKHRFDVSALENRGIDEAFAYLGNLILVEGGEAFKLKREQQASFRPGQASAASAAERGGAGEAGGGRRWGRRREGRRRRQRGSRAADRRPGGERRGCRAAAASAGRYRNGFRRLHATGEAV